MPDLNDFHAFKSTSGGLGGCGIGCSTPFWVILGVIGLLVLLGKCGA